MVSRTSIFQPGEFAHGNQEFFTVYTLVDITDTGVKRGNTKQSFQAQNLSNVLQAIGLRCQPIISSVLKLTGQAMSDYSFGSGFTGSQTVWALKFATEHSDQTSATFTARWEKIRKANLTKYIYCVYLFNVYVLRKNGNK